MTAMIDGKKFTAVSVMKPSLAGRIIGYVGEEYISIPYSAGYMTAGRKIKITEDYAIDLALDDDIGIWAGRSGLVEITKINGDWVEGRFNFIASSMRSNKSFKVTDGFFRISLK